MHNVPWDELKQHQLPARYKHVLTHCTLIHFVIFFFILILYLKKTGKLSKREDTYLGNTISLRFKLYIPNQKLDIDKDLVNENYYVVPIAQETMGSWAPESLKSSLRTWDQESPK